MYLCIENKDTEHTIFAFVFAYAKSRFSHDVAQIIFKIVVINCQQHAEPF